MYCKYQNNERENTILYADPNISEMKIKKSCHMECIAEKKSTGTTLLISKSLMIRYIFQMLKHKEIYLFFCFCFLTVKYK